MTTPSKYIIVSETLGTLVIRPTHGSCAGWSSMFPYGQPFLFETRRDANIVARLWNRNMNVLVVEAHTKPAFKPEQETIDQIEELVGAAVTGIHDSRSDEVFDVCRVCGDVDGHTDNCPVPPLERWLKENNG